MDNFDAAKATRVWQRVQASPSGAEGLPALIAEEAEDAATYIQLAKRLGGKEGQALRRQAPADRTLRRCYGREMRCLAQYESRANDPEYGPVFTRLAAQEREHCMAVLELIGKLSKE